MKTWNTFGAATLLAGFCRLCTTAVVAQMPGQISATKEFLADAPPVEVAPRVKMSDVRLALIALPTQETQITSALWLGQVRPSADTTPPLTEARQALAQLQQKPVADTPKATESGLLTPSAKEEPDLSSIELERPRAARHEISVSGDYLFGQGTVTLPVGFSLEKSLGGLGGGIKPLVAKPDRESQYYGGTVSYSFGHRWYLDLSYAHGESAGRQNIDLGLSPRNPFPHDVDFSIDDDWYQAYVKYAFRSRRVWGKPLSAYLRAGASYVKADLFAGSVIPPLGLYVHDDKTEVA